MSQEQQPATAPQIKWSNQKIILSVLAVLLLVGVSFFQLAVGKVRQAAEQSLLVQANEAVNGQVRVGSIDLSILGFVAANDVQLLNADGKLLAKSQRIALSYNWRDLLKGQLGAQLITAVTVEKPEIWVGYDQNGLNWAGVSKPKTVEQGRFAGVVELQDGKLHVATPYFNKTIEQVTGKLDFRQEDDMTLVGSGKVEQSNVRIVGKWGESKDSAIAISAANIDLVRLELTTADSPIRLTGGTLEEVTVTFGKDAAAAVTLQLLSGRFAGVTTVGALELSECSARFEKLDNGIQFLDGQALYQGQPVTAAGRVLTAADGTETLDFTAQMPAGNPAVLLSSLRTGGSLAVQATITGPVLAPIMAGSFTLGSIQFGDMTVSSISGAFSYTKNNLNLLSSRGTTLGGWVAASGDIYPATEQYALSISGGSLDSSRLTDKDVKGPLSLVGTANGDAAAAVLQGRFSIDNGTAYGIPFETLSGNFVKYGLAASQVSNLAIQTGLGTFYPEQLSQGVMEGLQMSRLPVTEEQAKEVVIDALLQKIFR